jgi:aspartyl/asparaginyl beta-hydroxylase (cupin superfamily)
MLDSNAVDSEGTWRFAKYLSSVASGDVDPVVGTYPDIDNSRWFDPDRFPICSSLEEHFPEIKREILALTPAVYYQDSEQIPRSGQWGIFPVLAMARKNSANASLLPITTDIAESHGAITTLTGGILVSRLKPGTVIATHRGPSNTRIRCHLGIQVPSGDCGIEVDGEKRGWQEGTCLMLNDHLDHNVWNRTEDERIVLIVDVWHPDLTAAEKTLITGLHVYADVQSQAISTWRERDSEAQRTLRLED